jgi:transcriptional regulator with XRE-family HTH domain
MSLGQQIKKYRKTLGLTLDQLSELSGVPPGTISALAVRNSVKSTYAPTLAKNGFGLSLEELLDTETDCLPKCFDHVNATRPSGWTPTEDLLHAVQAARHTQFVCSPTPNEIEQRSIKSQVKWPFKLISYKRLMDLQRELGATQGHEAIDDIDKTIEVVVLKWERQISTRKRASS